MHLLIDVSITNACVVGRKKINIPVNLDMLCLYKKKTIPAQMMHYQMYNW
jgi:hypothetical protein